MLKNKQNVKNRSRSLIIFVCVNPSKSIVYMYVLLSEKKNDA